jgi:hypothetical protein
VAAQTELLGQLVQGQQVIYQLLQQQHHHWDGHNDRQPQFAGYRELDEKIKDTRDIHNF